VFSFGKECGEMGFLNLAPLMCVWKGKSRSIRMMIFPFLVNLYNTDEQIFCPGSPNLSRDGTLDPPKGPSTTPFELKSLLSNISHKRVRVGILFFMLLMMDPKLKTASENKPQ